MTPLTPLHHLQQHPRAGSQGVGIAALIFRYFRYFLRYFSSTHRTDLSRFRGTLKIFVKTTLADNRVVSVTACHELFEMVIDPIANLWAEAADGTEYAYEMCDPVEEDTFLVDGIEMSNFVHPSWFEPFKHPPGTKFDHLGLLKNPFSMTKGGYVIIKKKGKVSEHFGSKKKEKRFAKEDRYGHRSEYRKPHGLVIKPRRVRTAVERRAA